MKPIKAPEDLDFESLPTLDDLKERTGLKLSALRARLAKVTCWKCSDNTVRYDAAAAEAALADADGSEEEDDFDPERKIDALFLLNKQIQINGQLVKQCNDVIKSMGEPLRSGVELWKASGDRQEKRLEALEKNFDRMLGVIEAGLNAQHDRELATQRQAANLKMRSEMGTLVKEELPKMVSKWALTAEATAALNFLRSLNPLLVDQVVKSGVLDPEQMAQLEKLGIVPKAPPAPDTSRGDASRAEGDQADGNDKVPDEKS